MVLSGPRGQLAGQNSKPSPERKPTDVLLNSESFSSPFISHSARRSDGGSLLPIRRENPVLSDKKLWLIICWPAQKCDTLGTPGSQLRFLTKRSGSLSVSLIHLDVSGELK